MIGVVDVGGERGVYGAAVLDWCLEQGIKFDYCIGVSAGAANLASYIAGQEGRNFAFYTTYSFRDDYMSLKLLARTGEYTDLDYIYGTLSNSDGEHPLDYGAIAASDQQFTIVATDARTAHAAYFTKDDLSQDDYAPIKASSALPLVNKPYPVKGRPCFDGGLSDPVPIWRALNAGCDKVVVILTRPRDFERKASADAPAARMLARRYPNISRALANRADLYNFQVKLAKRYESEGRALIVAPDDISGMGTLTKKRSAIEELYAKGFADARAIEGFLG